MPKIPSTKPRKQFSGVRPGKKPGTFVIDYYDHNRIRRRKIYRADKRSDAVKYRNYFLLRRDRVNAGLEQAPENQVHIPTLQELWNKFESDRNLKIRAGSLSPNTLIRTRHSFKAFIKYDPSLRFKTIDQIKSSDIEGFKIYRKEKGYSPSGTNIDLNKLRCLFNFAVKKEFLKSSPFKDISHVLVPKTDVRFLQEVELVSLFSTLKKLDLTDEFQRDAHDLTIFYLYTGARASEALYPVFQWNHILKDSIQFPITKGSGSRKIPKMQTVDTVLKSRGHIPGGPFHFSRHAVYKRIKFVMKKAEINNASTHTLRKTSGAWYYMATRDIFATSRFLGHSSVKVTELAYTGLIQSLKVEYSNQFEDILNGHLKSGDYKKTISRPNQTIPDHSTIL